MTIKAPSCFCRERLDYLNSLLTFDQILFILDGLRCRLSAAFLASVSELQMYCAVIILRFWVSCR